MTVSIHQQTICTTPTPARKPMWSRLHDMIALKRQRRQLRDLDDHLLKDIGISRQEALGESRQSPWNVPNYWHK